MSDLPARADTTVSDRATPASGQPLAKVTEDEAVTALRALLGHATMAQNIGLVVLSNMALDQKVPARERRRASEILLQAKLRAIEILGALSGSKEQRLHALGISQPPHEVHVEQHNTRIEIVREGTSDWRADVGA